MNLTAIRSFARLTGHARSDRFWEVDALRGVAIVMMVIYHLLWTLWFVRVLPEIVLYAGFWKYFQRTTASLFIVLVGVSLVISYNRALQKRGNLNGLWWKFLRRGAMLFGFGVVIDLVTRAANTGFVDFGVLHLIGFSVAVAYPFLRFRWPNLVLYVIFFLVGGYVETIHVNTRWLVWLGLTPERYGPVDFFPIFPWFGVVLLGVFLGHLLYDGNRRHISLPNLSGWLPFNLLEFLGRHSLFIYLVHQPLIFGGLLALGIV